MPARIPRACRKHGCAKTTIDRSGYCPDHINLGWEDYQQGRSRHARGYGSKWQKIRAAVITRDKGLCQNCKRNGRVTSGGAVDHIIPKAHGGSDELANLELICVPCHRHKTAKDRLQ